MRIRSLQLKNFKRFTDLTIEGIADDCKCVVVIGSNGSGKSSIFDAFRVVGGHPANSGYIYVNNQPVLEGFYKKTLGQPFHIAIDCDLAQLKYSANPHGKQPIDCFYGRSSLRIVPKIIAKADRKHTVMDELDAPATSTALDERFYLDVDQYTKSMNAALRELLFNPSDRQAGDIRKQFIDPFNEALARVFNVDLALVPQLEDFEEPRGNEPPKLFFKKGNSKIHFDLLSHGEKQVVITLLNFAVRKEYLQNKIIHIDEMDAHMHTQLQKGLIKEIVEHWITDQSQLWLATHSLGFIEYAQESSHACVVDLDALDFDIPQLIGPAAKNRNDVFNIAITHETLSLLMGPRRIVYVENTDSAMYKASFDALKYIAVPAHDKNQAFANARTDAKLLALIDKDFVTSAEREALLRHYPNLRMLKYYSIENYLFHPDNVLEHQQKNAIDFDREAYMRAWLAESKAVIEKHSVSTSFSDARRRYPFYKDAADNKILKTFQNSYKNVLDELKSGDFERVFAMIPAKDFDAEIKKQFNLSDKVALSQTTWFKQQITALL
jgi:ABC-type cobalamin/Fe3+-siderophores transport system ATPase subunit